MATGELLTGLFQHWETRCDCHAVLVAAGNQRRISEINIREPPPGFAHVLTAHWRRSASTRATRRDPDKQLQKADGAA